MKFSGKMCLMIILKIIKNQAFTHSLENFSENHRGDQIERSPLPSSRFRVKGYYKELVTAYIVYIFLLKVRYVCLIST